MLAVLRLIAGYASTCDERAGASVPFTRGAGLPEGLSAMRRLPSMNASLPRPMPEKSAPPWSAAGGGGDYVLPLSRLVHQFKFFSRIALAPLARLLLLAVLRTRRTRGLPPVDTLVNVPLFRAATATGGGDKSERPAVPSARPLAGLPVPSLCA